MWPEGPSRPDWSHIQMNGLSKVTTTARATRIVITRQRVVLTGHGLAEKAGVPRLKPLASLHVNSGALAAVVDHRAMQLILARRGRHGAALAFAVKQVQLPRRRQFRPFVRARTIRASAANCSAAAIRRKARCSRCSR